MNPIIIDNNLSAQLKVIHDNGDSLAIDGANGTWFKIALSEDATFTLTNIQNNIEYIFQCVSADGVITITLPNTADLVPQAEITLTATGAERLIGMIYDGTNRRWFISEEII